MDFKSFSSPLSIQQNLKFDLSFCIHCEIELHSRRGLDKKTIIVKSAFDISSLFVFGKSKTATCRNMVKIQ